MTLRVCRALCRVEDVELGEVGTGHLVPALLEHPAEVAAEHSGSAGDQPPRHQPTTTCWLRAYRASVARFIGRHHASLVRYQWIVAASPSRKLR